MAWLMHARELVQLAATVASHASLLVHSGEPFPEAAIELYWIASKSRQDGWGRALKQYTSEKQQLLSSSEQTGYWIKPILEEVLTAEPLTRIWTAVCELADAKRETAAAGPVAQNILTGHLEARNRVLNLMVYGYGLRVEEAVALNRLRLRNERWTDTLLSLIGPAAGRAQWAFQPRLVRRLAISIRQRDSAFGKNVATSLLMATLSAAYYRSTSTDTPHAEFNRRIACSVISCFPPQAFDATGQLISLRQLLLLQSTGDTQGQLNLPQSSPKPVGGSDSPVPPPPMIDGPFRRFDPR
jgi:hypothetical protein